MTNPLEIRPGEGAVEEAQVPVPDITSVDLSDGGDTGDTGRNISRSGLVLRRFLRKRLAIVGIVILVILALSAWVGPHLTHWKVADLDPNVYAANKGPSGQHWFGTDAVGHDLYVQTMSGLRVSLAIGFIAAFLTTFIAAVVGSVAGYFGKFTATVLMWIVDLLLVIPSFFIIAIMSQRLARGSNTGHWYLLGLTTEVAWLIILLAVFGWMITARVVRGMTLSLREREFVSAARFMGVNPFRIIARHILPNIASFLIVDVTLNVSGTILAETGLSFFGFGVQPPSVSLGTLIQTGTANPGLSQEYLWAFPGLMLILTVLAVNFIGDGLRDALDATSGAG